MRRTQLDEAEVLDRMAARESGRLTAGVEALHVLDPAEAMMRAEEGPDGRMERERPALEHEIFNGLLEYLLGEGPDPVRVRDRLEGALRAFVPGVTEKMRGPLVWVREEVVVEVLRRRSAEDGGEARLSTWVRALEAEEDSKTVARTLGGLIRFVLVEGLRWKAAVAVVYCLAKALRPELIGHMSLEDVARLSGDLGGRATPSARIRRIYNARVSAAGMLASHASFQKSEEACRRYAAAQLGNGNRKKIERKRKMKKARSAERGARN